jgi:hypothetical protein
MIETTVQIPLSPEALRGRVNAIARPRRGALQSPRNALRYDEHDTEKPYCGHWEAARLSLRPQSRGRWTNLHLWSTQFDGEVRPAAMGSALWIRASFGAYATSSYLVVLGLLLLTGISLMLHDPFAACIPLAFAAALVMALRAKLRRDLLRFVALLDETGSD